MDSSPKKYARNPKTNRMVKIGSKTYRRLVKEGLIPENVKQPQHATQDRLSLDPPPLMRTDSNANEVYSHSHSHDLDEIVNNVMSELEGKVRKLLTAQPEMASVSDEDSDDSE